MSLLWSDYCEPVNRRSTKSMTLKKWVNLWGAVRLRWSSSLLYDHRDDDSENVVCVFLHLWCFWMVLMSCTLIIKTCSLFSEVKQVIMFELDKKEIKINKLIQHLWLPVWMVSPVTASDFWCLCHIVELKHEFSFNVSLGGTWTITFNFLSKLFLKLHTQFNM